MSINIKKSGFYKLSEINSEKILIGDNIEISIFNDVNKRTNIDIGENSKVFFFGIIDNRNDLSIKFNQDKNGSELKVRYLLLSNEEEKLKAKISSNIDSSYTRSDVKIISIVGNKGLVDLDGIIKINEGIKKVEGSLSEENIFIGNTGKIKGVPTLLVRSNDVKASHACKMERISDEQLFYLRSRGVEKEDSVKIMLEAKVKDLFADIETENKEFYEKTIENILQKIY